MAAEAAISSLVRLLGDLLIQEVRFLRGVEGRIELLKDELKRMQSFLQVANRMLIGDPRISNWISEIRGAAQDAEDTIEMFLINVDNSRNWSFFKKFTRFADCVCHLHTLGEEIEAILAKLESINQSRATYGIQDLGEATRRSQAESRRRLASWRKNEHLVGMEDEVKKVLRELTLDEEKKGLSVVAVEGMGGTGKSTLAREIYNHPDVGRFDCRAWVVVSSEFTPLETMKQLLLQLPMSEQDKQKVCEIQEPSKDELYLLQRLQEMVYRQLEGKKYLIVMDDVWEKEHWESLRSAFPDEQDKTGRILLTTRNKAVAKCGGYVHEMKLLDHEKSWELFLKKARIGIDKCPRELEPIGRKIVEKCEGLPLTINMVAGLVMEANTRSGWEQVLNNINSHLERGSSSVSTILELSYLNLSPQLKSCFLCLAFFKEDAKIPTTTLVHIWAGHGLILHEETARDCLNMLVDQNMLQIENMTFDGRIKDCRLHDLLRQVCLRKAKEEIGFQILKRNEGVSISSESSSKPRHYVVHGENLRAFSLKQNKHLRSLFLLKCSFRASTWFCHCKSFRLLKILNLEGFELPSLPQSFRSLIWLKFLRIHSHSGNSLQLPRWLDQLTKLEVLDTRRKLVKFPNFTLKMSRLRYFSGYCAQGPKSISSWRNIETLKYLSLEHWLRCSSRLMAMDHSCRVRELGIMIEQDMESDDLRVSLERMENLQQLHLIYKPFFFSMCNLISLRKLKLSGKLSKCPTASMFPPNISYLILDWAELDEDPMGELGKLPNLLQLKLHKHAYVGERMKVLRDGFPRLEALSLVYLHKLRGVDVEEGGMPKLKQLCVRDCPALEAENLREWDPTDALSSPSIFQ